VRAGDATQSFNLNVVFTGAQATAPDAPKKELNAKAYNEGKANIASWYYYTGFEGTLVGTGHYSGGQVKIKRVGPAFQIGNGANGKNVHFGASGWFTFEIVTQPTDTKYKFYHGGEHGDFNVDLAPCAETGTTTSRCHSIDEDGKQSESSANFGIRVTTPKVSGNDVEIGEDEEISVDTSIIPDAADIGKKADIIIIGIYVERPLSAMVKTAGKNGMAMSRPFLLPRKMSI